MSRCKRCDIEAERVVCFKGLTIDLIIERCNDSACKGDYLLLS